ncbi:MAG: membrane protein insertase YidC [Flavobacteriaceae bacterium]|jgi:YidC/Oxa1 family membrane protein insertase|nr:membrane protein insertase YidC [Flavobacteriaceae bacterium]MBT4958411.1 membrane protein insertase YidC [Flavobacteriaceae bacterium]MBT6170913.1 membrane protein insertase YidC [Flavobacteriaceae bacterium]MDG1830426.1 membrane protein insertase YidC [Flavobacteriaceae bacterium]
MEENKIDPYQILGFVLLMAAFVWYIYTIPEPEQRIIENSKENLEISVQSDDSSLDSENKISKGLNLNDENSKPFVGSENKSKIKFDDVVLENDDLILKFSSKGGLLTEALLKNFTDFRGDPLYMIKDGNQNINLNFYSLNGQLINTSNYDFQPVVDKNYDGTKLSMILSISENQFLNFEYTLPKNGFMINFSIKSSGFRNVIDNQRTIQLNWDLKVLRQAKSVEYENRYSQLYYQYEGDETDYLSSYSDSDKTENSVSWISYGQHFFNSILVLNNPTDEVVFESKKLFEDEGKDVLFTKNYISSIPLVLDNSEFNSKMNLYIGPNDYDILKNYDDNIYESIYFGWGIFGWINRFIYFPLFGFLSKYFSAGLAVIFMTIITRLAMSPVTYKTYVSQARMKVLKPEIAELNEKYKNDAAKKQQETMKLYNKAGANPLLGCVPALFQLPVFYALFCFFPIAFPLRGKSFLWADDLSSYDVIAELPFSIPWYGDHVSLLPILASIAIFFYTMMSSGAQMQSSQPGMPNMKFIMYLMPVMMLFFFNNYASAFSLYYFVSNIITIMLMLMIKHFIIDEEKIHLQIQENKKKPTTQNRFQRKMQEMMDKAEEQRKLQNRK